MRIAWFRHANTDAANPLDGTAALIDELRRTDDIDIIVEANAHDFVWRQLQRPWDLFVFELDDTRAHQFIWGYMANYPGVVLLHSIDVVNLRVAILASRAAVAADRRFAKRLQERFPSANVRYAPAFAGHPRSANDDDLSVARTDEETDASVTRQVKFAIYDRRARGGHLIDRAFERARSAGATFDVLDRETTSGVLARSDVVIAPAWPPFHSSLTPLLAAMAAGKAVITTETETTAEWPAIDPQTWRPRGLAVADAPVAVTVDPRDEEHSLMLAIRKLSADEVLRDQLGRAAREWWETHATPAQAASAWAAILREATSLSPPPRPDDWPKQFLVDGSELARDIRSEFGLSGEGYESVSGSGLPAPGSWPPNPGSRIPDPGRSQS
jgi:glycosyltransferase involved in cell wall biosynthesis